MTAYEIDGIRPVVGAGSNIQDSCAVHCFPGRDTMLEENSHAGHGAIIHDCHIESNVLVGMNAVVMDGARVGQDSIIGANVFLLAGMTCPAHSLVLGMPAREVQPLTVADPDWPRMPTGRDRSTPLHESGDRRLS